MGFDKLFGRDYQEENARLKEELAELQRELDDLREEKEGLDKKLEKQKKRTKKAESEKQELHEKINRQEDQIQSLKNKLRNETLSESQELKDVETILWNNPEVQLSKIGSIRSEEEDLLTIFLPKDHSIRDIEDSAFLQSKLTSRQLESLENTKSDTGKVLIHSDGLFTTLIKPPLPIERSDWLLSKQFNVEPLLSQFDKSICLVFLSSGGSAVATFDRKEIEDYRLVKADIKSKHSKGGFSQDRFQRRRDEEIKGHIDDVEEVMEELPDADLIALSGSQKMVSELEKKDLIHKHRDKTFHKRLDLSNINEEKDLRKATHKFWKIETTNLQTLKRRAR
ncbi:MAG: Vms1/Ankzf1 family peptidyl-tRNA hydrolase [Halobacteriota archaeon]